jgi:drug/metabolite transporter (DMT)-like permease
MFAPGLISLAFYKRRPSRVQVILGLIATIVLSALLGYISPSGALTQLGSVILAVVGGVILYVAILAYLLYRYQPSHAKPPMATPPAPAP